MGTTQDERGMTHELGAGWCARAVVASVLGFGRVLGLPPGATLVAYLPYEEGAAYHMRKVRPYEEGAAI